LALAPQLFIAPELAGFTSGGTLFNRELSRELARAGEHCELVTLDAARPSEREGMLWVDSLYLDALPELARSKRPSARVGLLLHYLPSLLRAGDALRRADLSAVERAALDHADAFLVTSPFAAELLGRLGCSERPIVSVEPGRFATGARTTTHAGSGVQAALIANLAPNKGVASFLQALGRELRAADPCELEIMGGDAEPEYALACKQLAQSHPLLARRVSFAGALSPDEVAARLATKNLLVSASHVEAYGMALAEARTLGVPIVARRGGNVEKLVPADAGGELANDETELARAVAQLARNAGEHARRWELAKTCALPPRPWQRAAADFMTQLARLP
jgi:glycosyltransferase involved in cell wall biosynthesis